MSLVCRYGDEESWEEVPCIYKADTRSVHCPETTRRRGPLLDYKMEVVMEKENHDGSKVITTSLMTMSSEELKHLPETNNSNISSPAQLNTSQETTKDKKTIFCQWIFPLITACLGEFVGTFLLTTIICTVVAAAVIAEAQQGIWQVALPSGLGVAMSIFLTAHISDAHLNPAVTLAFAIFRFKQFHWSRVLPYWIAQFCGSILAGGFVYLFYNGPVTAFETAQNITRGDRGSEITAMIFGEYFPNPALYSHDDTANYDIISPFEALLVEAWGTLILVFVIFSVTHSNNTTIGNGKVIIPLVVAFTVACLISLYGPLTQAGLNPARDFGPRIAAVCAGWGYIAIPGPRDGFWVYILGPLIGGPIGGGLSDFILFITKWSKLVK